MKHEMRLVVAILTIASVLILAGLSYMLWGQSDRPSVGAKSFDECAGAGNPVMETHPRRCSDVRTGETFTEELDETPDDKLATRNYQSANGVAISIDNWADDRQVTSPLTITGLVPGSWSHEGSFPVEIIYQNDIGLSGTVAELDGDWMTDEMVPFTAELVLDEHLAGEEISIILRKANPSGLPDNDDSLELPVKVASIEN